MTVLFWKKKKKEYILGLKFLVYSKDNFQLPLLSLNTHMEGNPEHLAMCGYACSCSHSPTAGVAHHSLTVDANMDVPERIQHGKAGEKAEATHLVWVRARSRNSNYLSTHEVTNTE